MRIVVDPGHGGNDTGALGPTGYKEADFNMETAVLIDLLLRRHGHSVLMTRDGTEERKVPNITRVRMANDWNADVFLSIHANGFSQIVDRDSIGMEVLFWNTSTTGLKLADEIRREIIALFSELSNPHIYDRGSKPKYYGDRGSTVLSKTNMTAVIIEPGFITDEDDEAWLRRFTTQAAIASAIVAAVEK